MLWWDWQTSPGVVRLQLSRRGERENKFHWHDCHIHHCQHGFLCSYRQKPCVKTTAPTDRPATTTTRLSAPHQLHPLSMISPSLTVCSSEAGIDLETGDTACQSNKWRTLSSKLLWFVSGVSNLHSHTAHTPTCHPSMSVVLIYRFSDSGSRPQRYYREYSHNCRSRGCACTACCSDPVGGLLHQHTPHSGSAIRPHAGKCSRVFNNYPVW